MVNKRGQFTLRVVKWALVVLAILLLLLNTVHAVVTRAQDETPPVAGLEMFLTCIEPESESGSARFWFGYAAEFDITGTTSYFVAYPDLSAVGLLGSPLLDYPAGSDSYLFGVEFVQPDSAVSWETYLITESGEFQYTAIYADLTTVAPVCPQPSDASAADPMPDAAPPLANYGVGRNITAYVSGTPGVSRCGWAWTDGVNASPIAGTTGVEINGDGQTYCNLPLSPDNPDTNPAHYIAWVE